MAFGSNMQEWKATALVPRDLTLDWQNPRIEATKETSQEEIRALLIANESVVELAKNIQDFGGLVRGERVIVAKESGKNVVLEGNRRACAIQLLLNPELVPLEYKNRFPTASEILKRNLATIEVDIAPSRSAAEPSITLRHTEPGIRRWSPLARVRRAGLLFNEGRSIPEIASQFSTKDASVRQQVRTYKLIERAFNLSHLTMDEKAFLQSRKASTNPFTRFFDLKDAKSFLGIKFKDGLELETNLTRSEEDALIEHLVRQLVLPGKSGTKPPRNTRSSVLEILEGFKHSSKLNIPKPPEKPSPAEADEDDGKVGGSGRDGSGASGKPGDNDQKEKRKTAAKASVFFENTICSLQDDRLIALTKEIKKIDVELYPICGFFLLRAYLESGLEYKLRITKNHRAYKAWLISKNKKGGLKDMLEFCSHKAHNVFEPEICRALNVIRSHPIKDASDLVVHGNMLEATAPTLKLCAAQIRPFMNKLVGGEI